MPTVALSLQNVDGTLVEELAGLFGDSDLDVLRKFIKLMSRLRGCELMVRGLPGMTNLSLTAESGMQFTCEPYTNAELHDLLHVLRPVILQNEPFSFNKITALLQRCFTSRRFSDYVKSIRGMFENGELRAYMQITLGGQPLFDQSLLNLWLNAEQ